MKIKKIIKIILIIASFIIVLGIIFVNIDYSRIKNDKKPIFAIYIGKNKNTKADQYYGLGYTIIKCPEIPDTETTKYDNSYKLFLFSNSHICLLSNENNIKNIGF